LDLQLIAGPDRLQGGNGCIKVAMFLPQALDLGEKNAPFLLVQRLSHRKTSILTQSLADPSAQRTSAPNMNAGRRSCKRRSPCTFGQAAALLIPGKLSGSAFTSLAKETLTKPDSLPTRFDRRRSSPR
jgi:hypothetical protein